MNCISIKQLNLSNEMRMLWEQHVYWTRLIIISILNNLKDLKETEKRLLMNPVDIGRIYGRFYGPAVQREVTKLITEHLEIGGQLIIASKNNSKEEIGRLNTLWYQNADKIARYFASFNPYYNEEELRRMLYTHLDLTKNEVSLRLQGKYAEDVANFDRIEMEALEMADYFTMGIVYQFAYVFTCYGY